MHSKTLLVLCFATAVTASRGAHAKPLLIVSAEATGEVVLVDPAKAQAGDRIKVGPRPRGLKLSRDGRRLFVALAGPAKPAPPQPGDPTAGLAIVDVSTRTVTKQVPTPPAPFAVDVLPDGKTAVVSSSATNEVLAVDLAAGSVAKKKAVGMEPQGVAVRPDGKAVYVATHGADEISAIDPKTMNLLGRIDAGSHPQTVLFVPGGQLAVVIDEGAPMITIIDAKKNTFKQQFVLQGLAKAPAPALQAGVLSPDGRRLYVTTGPGRSVLIVELAKKAVVGTIDGVGTFPRGIAISRDGKKLYTANGPSNDVAIIDVASKKVESRVAVPGSPWAVVFAP